MTRFVSGISGLLRSIAAIALVAIAAVFTGLYLHYRNEQTAYQQQLQQALDVSRQRVEALEMMVERLTSVRRMAQIIVTDQHTDPVTGSVLFTALLIAELDENGRVCNRSQVTIPGRIAYFEGLVVKFEPDCVATAEPLRGHSLALLRRVYSESLAPDQGFPLDTPGSIPGAYRTHSPAAAEFEQMLWSRFWTLANDPAMAAELGVRVAQGEAVYKPMLPGRLYELTIDAIGGLNLETRPLPEAVSEVLAAASG
ncbi:MAG: hypothetical protein D8M59_03595 [Planctomycetes bacterium]|nr:hypothetical protein [Planctomycetota bacterium]NOG53081.1 hypothetical protein [Planctomycetota bacterium]